MSFVALFSEPIVTSRGIIIGSNYNGTPHFVQQFPIYKPTFNIVNSSNSYSNSKSTGSQTIGEADAETEASWEALRQRRAANSKKF